MNRLFTTPSAIASKGEEIVAVLTQRVRVLSHPQVARTWFAGSRHPLRAAYETLTRLRGKGEITLTRVMSHPEVQLNAPVLIWDRGDMLPNFDRIAWQLNRRWRKPPVSTLIAVATGRAALSTGGLMGGRQPRAREVTHDIHVTACYLKLRSENPELAKSWIHEDALGGPEERICCHTIPDAVVDGPRLIEFGGRYSAAKLSATHRDRAQHELAYEIW